VKKVMAYVFAGVRTQGLATLTRSRSVAAVPFAGKYRLIDFTLSNCANSELYRVAILSQYSPHSLIKHVGRGGPWDLNRRDGGVQILQPYERQEGRRWYQGTADALRQNLDVLDNWDADYVFVFSSELVYKMDYSWLLDSHRQSGARATMACAPPSVQEASHYGMVRVGPGLEVEDYEQTARPAADKLAFMGVYVFEAAYLREILEPPETHNLFLDCLLPRIRNGDPVRVYRFLGDWDGVITVADYLRAHRRLLGDPPVPNLYDPGWRVYTRSEEMPPVWLSPAAEVSDSFLSNGAAIEGRVERSVLSPGVVVGPGAVVRDSVVLNRSVIGPGAVVDGAVIDKHTTVGEGARIGAPVPAGHSPALEEISVIGSRAVVEPGAAVLPGEIVPARDLTLEDAATWLSAATHD